MRSELSIRRELLRCQRAIRGRALAAPPERFAELLGIHQALAWVLGHGAMAPMKAAGFPPERPKPAKGRGNARVR